MTLSTQTITPAQSYKKIIAIEITNCRAFYSSYDSIQLPSGENLLVYGENGSGKSSLFKALNSYLLSSRDDTLPFTKNRYNTNEEGNIRVTFADFDLVTNLKIDSSVQTLEYNSQTSTNSVGFIQNAALVKGFLDYRNLLDVYFHKESRPNLFNLIVLNLLGEHIPISSGGNFKFKDKLEQLESDLIKKSYTRNDRLHQSALRELPIYQRQLVRTLNEVFQELNRLLVTYFTDLKIELDYTLLELNFNYGSKWEWRIQKDLRLNIKKDGIEIEGDYSDILNEARLSAFAICLYLASLKRNPANIDLKILYLDDIFVGLDAGNRIPILNILRNEFSAYQIIISSYDKHWFELAKNQFEIFNSKSWLAIEIYVGRASIDTVEIDVPLVIRSKSNYEKAVKYLHDRANPDYPAAANYFRKAFEELISKHIPKWELADVESVQIPDYKLTRLAYISRDFLERTANETTYINQIISLLHALLHPLSHYSLNLPIYKGELVILESNISSLQKQLIDLNIPASYKCILDRNKRLRLKYNIDIHTNHYCYYEIILKSPLLLDSSLHLPQSYCCADKCYGSNNGIPYPTKNLKKTAQQFNYTSLNDAYTKIYHHLTTTPIGNFPAAPDFKSEIEYFNGADWIALNNILVW